MALPTVTRSDLRKLIGKRMGMRFFKLFDEYSEADASSSAAQLVDSALTQADDYWTNRWLYIIDGGAAGDVRKIVTFEEIDNKIIPDREFSASLSAGDDFQIFDIFSPLEIHDAINNAITEGANHFFGIATEQPLVVQTDTLEYSLSGFTNTPWKILKIWIEQRTSVIRGTATGGSGTTIQDSSNPWGGVESGWIVSIYDGTGKGQWREVSSAAAGELTVSAWATNPDSTSKYSVWDPSEQKMSWRQVLAARFDALEFPATTYFGLNPGADEGMRIRFQYIYQPGDLSSDSATTVVPEDYVVPYAMHLLYESKLDDNRVDAARYERNSERSEAKALRYAATYGRQMPAGTLWQVNELNSGGSYWGDNPMDWTS